MNKIIQKTTTMKKRKLHSVHFCFSEKKKITLFFWEFGAPCLYINQHDPWSPNCTSDLILGPSCTRCHSHPVRCPHRGSVLMTLTVQSNFILLWKLLVLISCSFVHYHFSAWFDCLHITSISALKKWSQSLLQHTSFKCPAGLQLPDWSFEPGVLEWRNP